MRGLWLTAGAVVTVIALALSTTLLWSAFAAGRTPTDRAMRSIPFEGSGLRVKTGRGQVHVWVMAGRAGELLLQRSMQWSKDRPTVTEDWDSATGTLLLDATCPGSDQPDGPLCEAEYTLLVPPETDLAADTAGGGLWVSDLFGDLRLTSVSGDVRVEGAAGEVWARAGTGSFTGEGLRGERADVEVGSGDVSLYFEGAPTDVRAIVRTAGDVRVTVREGVYDVTATGENTTVDVRRRAGAARRIVAGAGGGTVTVCCR
ncbi:hypothetical protein [Nonomuraea candida]|uniref:hypothetical protein n=1 Tax=Nonomuraea candida TaxID=359159 RepID=UPI000694C068|nr:hypothetical protein [Nonomuraea candida]